MSRGEKRCQQLGAGAGLGSILEQAAVVERISHLGVSRMLPTLVATAPIVLTGMTEGT
jgi:hypothetical protein